jgi:hypothetical protein
VFEDGEHLKDRSRDKVSEVDGKYLIRDTGVSVP